MLYQNFKTLADLQKIIETSQIITGQFLCEYDSQAFYAIDSACIDKIFKNFVMVGGSFVSATFLRCTFDNVIFRKTEFITLFEDCEFKDCTFSNVDSGFTMKNVKIGEFHQFSEEEKLMEFNLKKMHEKALK